MTKHKPVCIVALLFLLSSCMVSQRSNMSFLDDPAVAKNANIVSVNVPMLIAKPFIKKALREEKEDAEVLGLVKAVKKVKVMTISQNKPAVLSMYGNYLNRNRYDDWISINHEGQKVRVSSKGNDRMISKLLLAVESDSSLVFVDITGKFTHDDIARIIHKAQQ